VTAAGNVITETTQAASITLLPGCVVENNTVTHNAGYQVISAAASTVFRRNVVMHNTAPLTVNLQGPGDFALNLFNNSAAEFELKLTAAGQVVSVPYNWWGSASPAFVASRLQHFAVDSTLGAAVASPFLVAPSADAATASIPDAISGVISADTTWTAAQSPLSLQHNTLIVSGKRLLVEAGVTVRLGAAKALFVAGGLQVNGSAEAPVLFTAAVAGQPWSHIYISPSAQGCVFAGDLVSPCLSGSFFRHAVIENGGASTRFVF
jgi:hypothetical protein